MPPIRKKNPSRKKTEQESSQTSVKERYKERNNQFNLISKKFESKKNEPRKRTQLATFIDINVNQSETAINELNVRYQKALLNRPPSIFNDNKVNALLNKNTFVVAFAHPTYTMDYLKTLNGITINCAKINRKLLFFDKNKKMMNVLPDHTAFMVQINDHTPMNVQTARFDEKLELNINLSSELLTELIPIQKCVIYFNIIAQKNMQWVIPQELLNTFANLQLAAPNQLLQTS
jgi:hypothetical protein